MKTCVIFCAGECSGLAEQITEDALVIAADGGLSHTEALGITPDVILGDFDSLGYIPQKSQVFPVEKDDTDSMLAAKHGLQMGCDRFVFYGALEGPRLDHTVANFQTLQFLADRNAKAVLVGKDTLVTVLKNGEMRLPALEEGTVSVFCQGGEASGVRLQGLQYPLENGTLSVGFPLGVSNHLTGKAASISVEKGSLLVFYPRKAGLCI
jgi:thiamine pyrophosphokinase